jgi:hypothetical protein
MSATASILSLPATGMPEDVSPIGDQSDWVSYLWFAEVSDALRTLPAAPSKLSRTLKSAVSCKLAPHPAAAQEPDGSQCLPLPYSIQAHYRMPRLRNVTNATITKKLPSIADAITRKLSPVA